jgi:hypothetical protein
VVVPMIHSPPKNQGKPMGQRIAQWSTQDGI